MPYLCDPVKDDTKNEVPLLEFITYTMRFIASMLTSSHNLEHGRVMVEKGGLSLLLKIYSLTSLPLNFVQSSAAQALAVAYRSLSAASPDSAKEVYTNLHKALSGPGIEAFVLRFADDMQAGSEHLMVHSLAEDDQLHRSIAAVARYADLLTPLIRQSHSQGRNEALIEHVAQHECESLRQLRKLSLCLLYQLADADRRVWAESQVTRAKEMEERLSKEKQTASETAAPGADETAAPMETAAPTDTAVALPSSMAADAATDASTEDGTPAPTDEDEDETAMDTEGAVPSSKDDKGKDSKAQTPLSNAEKLQNFLLCAIHSMITSFAQHMRLALNHKQRHSDDPHLPTVHIAKLCEEFAKMLTQSIEIAEAVLSRPNQTAETRMTSLSFADRVVSDIKTQLFSIPRINYMDERTLHTYLFVFFCHHKGFDTCQRIFQLSVAELLKQAEADPSFTDETMVSLLKQGTQRSLVCHQVCTCFLTAWLAHLR